MERIALAFSPLRDASPRDIVSWSRDAEERGYEAVFIPESYCDSLAYAEAVALATSRLRVGTGVTNVYLRQPTLLAAEAAAVQEISGGRLVLGVDQGADTAEARRAAAHPRRRARASHDRACGRARRRRHVQPLPCDTLSARPGRAPSRRRARGPRRRRARGLSLHHLLSRRRLAGRAARGAAHARALRQPPILREHARPERLRGRGRGDPRGLDAARRRGRGAGRERRPRGRE